MVKIRPAISKPLQRTHVGGESAQSLPSIMQKPSAFKLRLLLSTATVLLLISGFAQDDDLEREALQNIPDSDYSVFISIKPAEIFCSPLMQGYKIELNPDDAALAAASFRKLIGISPEEFDIGVGLINWDMMDPRYSGYYARGPFTPAGLKTLIESQLKDSEIQESTSMGRTYWKFTTFQGEMAFTMTESGFIGGSEACVLDAIAMAGKSDANITGNEVFSRAYKLIDANASSKFLLWNLSSESSSIGKSIRQMVRSSGNEKFTNAQQDLETIGGYAQIGSDIKITIRILYNKSDSARDTAEYFQTELTNQRKQMTDQDAIRIADSVRISLSGSLIEVHMTIPGDYPALVDFVRNLVSGFHRSKQSQSIYLIQELGKRVEMYILDHPSIGAPKAETVEELNQILNQNEEQRYFYYARDGWDNSIQYRYEPVLGSRNYTIISYGADGKPGPVTVIHGVVIHFIEDIIWARGNFVQKPQERDK